MDAPATILGFLAITAFDTNGNCAIDPAEFNLLVTPFFALDLDLLDEAGNYDPLQDGVNDSFSVGLGFTAVNAAFARP